MGDGNSASPVGSPARYFHHQSSVFVAVCLANQGEVLSRIELPRNDDAMRLPRGMSPVIGFHVSASTTARRSETNYEERSPSHSHAMASCSRSSASFKSPCYLSERLASSKANFRAPKRAVCSAVGCRSVLPWRSSSFGFFSRRRAVPSPALSTCLPQ